MPRCPFCEEELEHLEVECYERCWTVYEVYPDNDPRFPPLPNPLVWEQIDKELPEDGRIERARCPYCHAPLLLKDEDEIEEFFKGSLIVALLNDPRTRMLNEKRMLFNGKLYEIRRTYEIVRDPDGIVRDPFSYDKPEQRFTVLLLSEL